MVSCFIELERKLSEKHSRELFYNVEGSMMKGRIVTSFGPVCWVFAMNSQTMIC